MCWVPAWSLQAQVPQASPSLCLAASLPFVILTLVNSPYKRGFYCNDDSIRYPYKADTITHGLMAGVTITCTVLIVRKRRAPLQAPGRAAGPSGQRAGRSPEGMSPRLVGLGS